MEVHGDFLPQGLFGMFHLLFAAVRSLFLALHIYAFCPFQYDVIIVDQIPYTIPILRHCAGRVLFYCHFPDKFLAPRSRNPLRLMAYRHWFDRLEEATLGKAHRVLVNSQFTAGKYKEAFPGKPEPAVLYPGVSMLGAAVLSSPFPWPE